MKLQSSQSTVPRWLKWLFLSVGVLLLLGLVFAIWMYAEISQDRIAGYDPAAQIAMDETPLASVDEVTAYYGDQTVHIVQGQLEEGDPAVIYVDVEAESVLEMITEDALTLEEFTTAWQQACGNCSFEHVQYGYEEQQPVFEVTYVDDQNRYVFDYFQLNGESFDQRFAFRQDE
ncbi:hypothetical protein EQV77_03100 [Halobacillus fulvus]|nr:hypothetical protein EQV77_03100 [Halobacillus fulvus]